MTSGCETKLTDSPGAITTIIRIHNRTHRGIVDRSEDFEIEEFVNTLPAPGDKIVASWTLDDGKRTDPESRVIYEVVERYFLPNAYDRDRALAEDTATNRIVHVVALVVEERPADESERRLLW